MHLKILIAQAFVVGGLGMLMAWYITIILVFGEDIRGPLGMGGLSLASTVYHKGSMITI
jgi:hypothetical protein